MKTFLLVSLSLCLVACDDVRIQYGNVRCFDLYDPDIKGEHALFNKLISHPLATPISRISGVDGMEFRLSAQRNTLWKTNRIPVCWVDETWEDKDQAKRDLVRESVQESWEEALWVSPEKNISFVGWTKCSEGNNTGVKIKVKDGKVYVSALGSLLTAADEYMYLNFSFENESVGCHHSRGKKKHEECIASHAVHEFGHALGLTHEQNRIDRDRGANDAQVKCDASRMQGTIGNTNIGAWDLDSVMNYCNLRHRRDYVLSDMDRVSVRALYYPELFTGTYCIPMESFEKMVIPNEG